MARAADRTASLAIPLLRETLARGEKVEVRCKGGSMLPTLRDGERVEVAPCPRAELGDALLIADGTTLILHRLIARFPPRGGARWIAHCGDAHWRTVGLVRASSVLGVAAIPRAESPRAARWATALWALGRWVAVRAWHGGYARGTSSYDSAQ